MERFSIYPLNITCFEVVPKDLPAGTLVSLQIKPPRSER
jgi:hypothetical protein